jgi:hypothetical protein
MEATTLPKGEEMKNWIAVLAVLVVGLTTACGGGGGVSGPSAPSIPTVSGNYSGNVNVVLPEVPASMTCPATTSVTQSGNTINVAPIIMGGQCGGASIPLGQAHIDNTGAIDGGSGSGAYYDSSCGGTYNYTASGGFFGRDLRLTVNATSTTCLNINMTMVLTR